MPKLSAKDLWSRQREKNRLESDTLDADPEVRAAREESRRLLDHEIETAEPDADDEAVEEEEDDD